MDDKDVLEACQPTQQGQAADRVVGSSAAAIPNNTAVKVRAEEGLRDASGVKAGHCISRQVVSQISAPTG